MAVDSLYKQRGRAGGRPFQKGQSLTRKAIELALEGDTTALRTSFIPAGPQACFPLMMDGPCRRTAGGRRRCALSGWPARGWPAPPFASGRWPCRPGPPTRRRTRQTLRSVIAEEDIQISRPLTRAFSR
jgi:hypothetical protein